MNKIWLSISLVLAFSFANAQKKAAYFFSNSYLSQNLNVQWVNDTKITVTYTVSEKDEAGKWQKVSYKGTATSIAGATDTDEDIDGAYDVNEYSLKNKTCTIKFRIAKDKSKCRVITMDCTHATIQNIGSFDTLIKK
jgi:hypothetical protein